MDHDGYSPFGTPIANSTRSLLTPRPGSSSSSHSTGSSSVSSSQQGRPLLQRLKGQDLYGGPVTFGGGNASTFFRQRRERLMAASPYGGGKRPLRGGTPSKGIPAEEPKESGSNNRKPLTSGGPPADAMSSTAKLILDTLERMSTPLGDARKIPVTPDVSRAEKRRLIAEELDSSLLGSGSSGQSKRKRPNLRGGGGALNGPPIRTCFSPVLNKKNEKRRSPESSVALGNPQKEEKVDIKQPTSNGLPSSDAITSSIEAYKNSLLTPSPFEDVSTAGGKMRIKDTVGNRSGRMPLTASAPPCSSLSNGWPPPTSNTLEKSSIPSFVSPPTPQSTIIKTLVPPPKVTTTDSLPPSKPLIPSPPVASLTPIQPSKPLEPLPKLKEKTTEKEPEVPSPVFAFSEPLSSPRSLPKLLTQEDPDKDSHLLTFTFSHPQVICSSSKSSAPNGGVVLPTTSSSSNIKTSFSTFSAKNEPLVGSKGSLPDITVSPGQLKKGSVLSALCKMEEPRNPRI
eukprot:TRINITY_DN5348_c0_g1_i1.p1 TRINITY_DN5348_c0_g1~~TRINITY_DN5348_c0_g1_i1.p1  ORF type:complete len:510 (+),score=148.97 TRINITY_DN5348_c0_g1_i1:191-1720(+)